MPRSIEVMRTIIVPVLRGLLWGDRPHQEQGFRARLGIVRLTKPFGAARGAPQASSGARRSERSPKRTSLDRHSSFTDGTQRSA
jgi:hypothetical protein